MLKKLLLATAILPSVIPFVACADATLTYQGSGPDGKMTTTLYITGDHLRMDVAGAQRPVKILYDRATDETIMLDQQKKQYMKMSQVMKQAEAASDMMQQALKNVPPEQRAMMSKMMGSFGKKLGNMMKQPQAEPAPVKATFAKTGKTDAASGVSCEWVKRVPANSVQSEFCVADYNKLGLSKADYATVKAFMAKSKKMAASAERMSGGMIKADQMMDGDVNGLPVKTRDNAGRKMALLSKKPGANPPGGFGIPAGYSAMTMPAIPR